MEFDGLASLERLQDTLTELVPSQTLEGDDFMSYITAGTDIMEAFIGKYKYIRNIYVITNGTMSCQWDTDNTSKMRDYLVEKGVTLHVYGIDFELMVHESSKVEGDEGSEGKNRWENIQQLSSFASYASLEVKPFHVVSDEIIRQAIRQPASRGKKSTLILGNSELSDELGCNTLEIGVSVSAFIRTPNVPSAKTCILNSSGKAIPIERVTDYKAMENDDSKVRVVDEDGDAEDWEVVPKEMLTAGYRFGRSLIPVDDETKEAARMDDEPSKIDLYGLIPQEKFKPWYIMGSGTNSNYIVGENESEQLKMTALVAALEKGGYYLIARHVDQVAGKNSRTEQSMSVLIPYFGEENNQPVLILDRLPYKEDFRQYQFPSLEEPRTINGKLVTKESEEGKERIPSNRMNRLFGDLIDTMMLTPYPSEKNNHGLDIIDPLDTMRIHNPTRARYKQVIKWCSMNGTKALPQIPPEFVEHAYPSYETIADVAPILSELSGELDIQRVLSAKEQRDLKQKNDEQNAAGQAAQPVDINIDDLIAGKVETAGNSSSSKAGPGITPLADLQAPKRESESATEAIPGPSTNVPANMPSSVGQENPVVDFRNRLEGFSHMGESQETLLGVCREYIGVIAYDLAAASNIPLQQWREYISKYKQTTENKSLGVDENRARELLLKMVTKKNANGEPLLKTRYINNVNKIYSSGQD